MFDMDMTSCYIPTTFGDTHVLCFGDTSKKPLFLLQGMTMSSTMWFPNMKQLIQERCVYAVDVMGDFGKSKPNGTIKNKKAAHQWILEVLNAMQFDKVDLAGNSMGVLIFSLSSHCGLKYNCLLPNELSKYWYNNAVIVIESIILFSQ